MSFLKDKRGFVDLEEVMTLGFFILLGVGYITFVLMLFILKAMGSGDIMPWWVKIVTILAIPIAAYVFKITMLPD